MCLSASELALDSGRLKIETWKVSRRSSRSPKYAEFGHLMLFRIERCYGFNSSCFFLYFLSAPSRLVSRTCFQTSRSHSRRSNICAWSWKRLQLKYRNTFDCRPWCYSQSTFLAFIYRATRTIRSQIGIGITVVPFIQIIPCVSVKMQRQQSVS